MTSLLMTLHLSYKPNSDMQRVEIGHNNIVNRNWSLGNISYEISIPAGVLGNQMHFSKGEFRLFSQ